MNYAIIVSEEDKAGINIMNSLLELFPFEKKENHHQLLTEKNLIFLYKLSTSTVDANHLDKKINADFFIFATRHQSKEGVLSLSCHSPGNFGKAEHGGIPGKLSISSAIMQKKAFLELKKEVSKLPGYEATLEATHHGPFMQKPCMFIEIGSSEKQWENKDAGKILAEIIIKIINSENMQNQKIAIGIGGTHYCANFNKLLERTDFAISHICPKYSLADLSEELLSQMIKNSLEKVEYIILDWKGLGSEKERIKSIAEKTGLMIERVDKQI